MRRVVNSLLCLVWLATFGCASSMFDFSDKERDLKEAQRKYTELVRWGEIESASAFVDPSISDAFLETAQLFQNIRFTDFESGPLEFGEESETATVNVVYHAYSTRTLVEKKFRERQEWYREGDGEKRWRVRPNLEGIAKQLSGAR